MNNSSLSPGKKAICIALSVIIAFVIGGIVIACQGKDPFSSYAILFRGAFGSMNNIGEGIIKAIPMAFCGLSVMFAYKCSVFNTGAQGQVVWGAIATMLVALNLQGLPPVLVWILSIIAGAVFGGIWGGIPGVLKAYRGVNEIITTILMNYIAAGILTALVSGPMREAAGLNLQTDAIDKSMRLTILFPGTRIHLGVIVVILATAAIWYYFKHTVHGFNAMAVGYNRDCAECSGINNKQAIVKCMLIAGAIAGIAGSIEMLGVQFRLMNSFSGTGYGFDGMAMALIGQLNPFGILLCSLGFGFLRTGADTMQRLTNIPTSTVDLIEALIILFVVCEFTYGFLKSKHKPCNGDKKITGPKKKQSEAGLHEVIEDQGKSKLEEQKPETEEVEKC